MKNVLEKILTWIKVYSLFILRVFILMIYFKIIYLIIILIDTGIETLFNLNRHELPYISYVDLICFGVSLIFSLKTTYYINGTPYRVLGNKFGFNPEEYKE